VNTAREERRASVRLDLKKLGVDPARCVALDAETGERYDVRGGRLTLDVPARMWRAVRLMQPKALSGGTTFIARFDTEAAADEAFGSRYPRGKGGQQLVEGKAGKALSLAEAVTFEARHHVTAEKGSITFQIRLDPATSGTLVAIGDVRLALNQKRLSLQQPGTPAAQAPLDAPAGWHAVSLRWSGGDVTISVDGAVLLKTTLAQPLPIRPMARGLEIADHRRRISPTGVTFGPLKEGALDDLVMGQ